MLSFTLFNFGIRAGRSLASESVLLLNCGRKRPNRQPNSQPNDQPNSPPNSHRASGAQSILLNERFAQWTNTTYAWKLFSLILAWAISSNGIGIAYIRSYWNILEFVYWNYWKCWVERIVRHKADKLVHCGFQWFHWIDYRQNWSRISQEFRIFRITFSEPLFQNHFEFQNSFKFQNHFLALLTKKSLEESPRESLVKNPLEELQIGCQAST